MNEDDTLEPTRELDHFLAGVEQRAYRMAYIATGDRDEALDLVQEAMYKLVQSYRQRPAAEWPALFQRILQSKIRDRYRRQRVRQALQRWFGDGDDPPADIGLLRRPNPGPERDLDGRHAMEALDRALNRLPLRQQQAFLLRQWEGLDVAATAAAMGCSQGSVKTHYSRALHNLRKQLEDHWP